MMRATSWRVALRLAGREALRSRGRSALVLVMIALPVLAVTAADVLIRTQDVSSVESLDRRLGTAQAEVVVPNRGAPVTQAFDPFDGSSSVSAGRRGRTTPTAAQLSAALGGARLLEVRTGDLDLVTEHGVGHAAATEIDLTDPLAQGLFRLTSGRWPRGTGEVVVNQALLDKGYAVGGTLELSGSDAPAPTIVGVAESTTVRSSPVAAGPVGSLGVPAGADWGGPQWLAGGDPVPWATVQRLNSMGALVASRAVIEDPPPDSALDPEIRSWSSGTDHAVVAVVVLVVVMALLEVVLLAGPAFAVSARRLARSLALMAAAGGTPAQSRRVVLAGGLVLGGAAAALGVVLGIGAGRLLEPVFQQRSSRWFGPFEVPWLHLAGITAFGLVSAVLAALVPAWIASRQDVVAVLAGRRADRAPSLRSPVLGVLLLGAGVAGSAYGATAQTYAEFLIAGSAVVAVLGMILLVPLVVVGVARLSAPLPLAGRYAARDAARHRTRTVPAVAAVAATVAGVVALGIAISSDEAGNRATYHAQLPLGVGAVTDWERRPDWDRLRTAVEDNVPGATVTDVVGVPNEAPGSGFRDLRILDGRGRPLLDSWSGSLGSSVLVDDGSHVGVLPDVPADRAVAAARVLRAGGAVVFTSGAAGAQDVRITLEDHPRRGRGEPRRAVEVPALLVPAGSGGPGLQAVVAPEVAAGLRVAPQTTALLVSGTAISAPRAQAASEAVTAVSTDAGLYVERGYQADDATRIVQLVLAGLGAVLMLGGTLTATFLALSDARPDLATLSAVGASPRRRRSVAASYALVVGFVGSVLGAAVGFIPGIAVTYPLTSSPYADTGPYLDVPWLLVLGLVVGLPLLTALVVGLTARSRLPMVARLD